VISFSAGEEGIGSRVQTDKYSTLKFVITITLNTPTNTPHATWTCYSHTTSCASFTPRILIR